MSIKNTDAYSMLSEAHEAIKKDNNIDFIRNPRALFESDEAFDRAMTIYGQGLNEADQNAFEIMGDTYRNQLLENVTPQLNPYESLSLPLLRAFWPKIAVRQMLTMLPMSKPTIVKYFINFVAKKHANAGGASFPLPNPHVSSKTGAANDSKFRGDAASSSINIDAELDIATNHGGNLLTANGLSSDYTLIEKGSLVIKAVKINGVDVVVDIPVTVNGMFAYTSSTGDTVSGQINYKTGDIELQGKLDGDAVNPNAITHITFGAVASLEYNSLNTQVVMNNEKFIIDTDSRKMSAEYSLEFEQDARTLFGLEAQAEIVDIMGQQIAVDYENEIITDLFGNIDAYNAANGNSHKAQFDKTVPGTFQLGRKEWFKNALVYLEELSAQIHVDTNIGAANTILCNPLDGVVLDGLRPESNGIASSGAYSWKILQTPLCPKGRMMVGLNPDNEKAACYYWAVYKPVEPVLGYPVGNIPSLTVWGRYAKKMIRPAGFAELEIIQS